MDFSADLKKISKNIIKLEVIELDDIPEIDLYMDQVTTFIETKLSSYKRAGDQKILTKTMINNYAKTRLFPPPVKKKYNKNHIILLVLIYHLKSVLSINDIHTLLTPVVKELIQNPKSKILEEIYSNFIIIQKFIATHELGTILTSHDVLNELKIDKTQKNHEIVESIVSVLVLVIYAGTEKRMAEKIIDEKLAILKPEK